MRAAIDSRNFTGILCIVGSALGFGTMAILARIAYGEGVDIPTLLALRFGIAAVIMAAIASRQTAHAFTRRTFITLVLLGVVGYAGQSFAFFLALTYAPAGVIALLLYIHPALVALLSAWLLHEHLDASKLAALMLALAGMILTIAPSLSMSHDATPAQPAGIVLGVAAAAIYACYIIVSAPIARTAPAVPMSTVVIASAAAVFVIAVVIRGPQWPASIGGWAAVGGIALISTVTAITLYFAGLARVGPTKASTLSTIEPAFTVALAALVLGERMGAVQVAGGLLILIAVVLLARSPEHVPESIVRTS